MERLPTHPAISYKVVWKEVAKQIRDRGPLSRHEIIEIYTGFGRNPRSAHEFLLGQITTYRFTRVTGVQVDRDRRVRYFPLYYDFENRPSEGAFEEAWNRSFREPQPNS